MQLSRVQIDSAADSATDSAKCSILALDSCSGSLDDANERKTTRAVARFASGSDTIIVFEYHWYYYAECVDLAPKLNKGVRT